MLQLKSVTHIFGYVIFSLSVFPLSACKKPTSYTIPKDDFYPRYISPQYPLEAFVTSAQADSLKAQITKKLPKNTQIIESSYKGYFTLSPAGYLQDIIIENVKSKLSMSTVFVAITSTVEVHLISTLNDGDCTDPTIIFVDVKFSHPFLRMMFKYDKLQQYAVTFIKEYLIQQTNLELYCKIKKSVFQVSQYKIGKFDINKKLAYLYFHET